jgi:hypothetical protein
MKRATHGGQRVGPQRDPVSPRDLRCLEREQLASHARSVRRASSHRQSSGASGRHAARSSIALGGPAEDHGPGQKPCVGAAIPPSHRRATHARHFAERSGQRAARHPGSRIFRRPITQAQWSTASSGAAATRARSARVHRCVVFTASAAFEAMRHAETVTYRGTRVRGAPDAMCGRRRYGATRQLPRNPRIQRWPGPERPDRSERPGPDRVPDLQFRMA